MRYFNSIKVRLERQSTRIYSPQLGDFNSIKVRLELCANVFVNNAYEFQFHKGAIRTEETNIDIKETKISIP